MCGAEEGLRHHRVRPLPSPAQAVLHAAVAGDSHAEQLAADRVLEAYCSGNAAGQAVLAGWLLNAAGAAPGSFRGFLLASLGRQGSVAELAASSRAAAALSHLIDANEGMQPHLLALQVPMQQPLQTLQQPRSPPAAAAMSGSVSLMTLCTAHLGLLVTQHGRQAASLQAAANTLRLLLLWMHACPPAVTGFLRSVAQSQPFLVDSIRGSNACSAAAASAHPLTRGMLALLLGLCASYAEDGAGTPTQQQLLGAINQQIGTPQFLAILEALLQHPAVAAAAPGTPAPAGTSSSSIFGDEPSPSPAFAAFLQMVAAEVRQRVTGVAAAPPPLPPAPGAVPQHLPQPPQPPAFHAPPQPPTAAPAAYSNGPAPYVPQHAHAVSPRASGGSAGTHPFTPYGSAPAPYSPARPGSPPAKPPSVPMYTSATAAAVVLHSPRAAAAAARGFTPPFSQPPSPLGSVTSDAATHLQQLVDTLQR